MKKLLTRLLGIAITIIILWDGYGITKEIIKLRNPEIVFTEIIKEKEIIMQDKEYYKGLKLNELIKTGLREGDITDIAEIYKKKIITVFNLTSSYEMVNLILFKAIEYDIPVNILFALVEVESEFKPNAVSKKGAIGLMQLMPQYFKQYTREELFNIYTNVDAGCEHLRGRYDKYGKWVHAIYYYIGSGPEALDYVAKVLAKENEYNDYFNEEY